MNASSHRASPENLRGQHSTGNAVIRSIAMTALLGLIGVGSMTRSPLLPDVPTLNESGAPGYEFTVYWGIVAPAGTSTAIVTRLNAEFNTILLDPEAAKQLAAEGAEVTPWTPAQFGTLLTSNLAMWKRVARESNIRAE